MSPRPIVLVVANSPEGRMRMDHPVLVEQGQLAGDLEHALDHEHHVRTAGVVFVEHQRGVGLQGPGQDALAELGDLLAVPDHDGVLADQVDAADVAVQVDADARPVEARGDLLDMGRLAGAVIALDHDPAVVREAGQNGQCGLVIEEVVLIHFRHVFPDFRKGGNLQFRIDAENLPDRNLHVGFWSRLTIHMGIHDNNISTKKRQSRRTLRIDRDV